MIEMTLGRLPFHRSRLALAIGMIALFGVAPSLWGQEDLKELAREARSSVVLLEVFSATGQPRGTGTGFFVDEQTLVTNFHVIEGAASARMRLADGGEQVLSDVMAEDAGADLAILRVEGAAQRGLSLYAGGMVEPGEEVVVLGNPHGLSGTLSTGIVSAWRRNEPELEGFGIPLIQITAPISPGSSGSPVMNREGEVLGVAVAVHRSGQNLNFAVPVEALTALLSQVSEEPIYRLGASRTSALIPGSVQNAGLWRNGILSLLVFGALFLFFRRL